MAGSIGQLEKPATGTEGMWDDSLQEGAQTARVRTSNQNTPAHTLAAVENRSRQESCSDRR
jgi:hypothetical protein